MKRIGYLLLVLVCGCTDDITLPEGFVPSGMKTGDPEDAWKVIVINEVLSKGSTYKDYIELYNTSDAAYKLRAGRWFVTDTLSDRTKCEIPETVIPAKGFLVLWGEDYAGSGIKFTFNLSSDEAAGLYYKNDDGEYEEVDTYDWDNHIEDNALGRYPDGNTSKFTDLTPTPGAANSQ